jgi:hypothetical protein
MSDRSTGATGRTALELLAELVRVHDGGARNGEELFGAWDAARAFVQDQTAGGEAESREEWAISADDPNKSEGHVPVWCSEPEARRLHAVATARSSRQRLWHRTIAVPPWRPVPTEGDSSDA